MLVLSACTKENTLPDRNPAIPLENNKQDPYSSSYSNWTTDLSLSWNDGATTDPSRQTEWAVPELTQELLDAGSFVLIYAKSNVDGLVQTMPAQFSDVSSDEINSYSATSLPGAITVLHTRSLDGTYEIPNDANEISFRYIIVNPNTPDPNARQITMDDFLNMSYNDVVNILGIPE